MRERVEVQLLGELALRRGGVPLTLPASRKTRALFAYLLLAGRPVRRERLCELFFDIPDDPRAALRWSLTKIRAMLGDDADLLAADRERVALDRSGFRVDIDLVEAGRPVEQPLAGLDLPGLDDYALWLAAERAAIEAQAGSAQPLKPPVQDVRYCFAPDGARIAYAVTGGGPTLVKTANWLNHLELDIGSPLWGRMVEGLSQHFSLVRYDERGNGLSDWEVPNITFDALVNDLECVVDALGLERFPLFGLSQGAAVSIEYTARHPERVTRLVLLGGYACGWRHRVSEAEAAEREAVITLVRHGWAKDSPVYRQIFSQTFTPSATPEELEWFNDFQRETVNPRNAAAFLDLFGDIDVRRRLPEIGVPTLVLHARGDQRIGLEQAQELASAIPDAALVTLDSDNHILRSREPAMDVVIDRIRAFLA